MPSNVLTAVPLTTAGITASSGGFAVVSGVVMVPLTGLYHAFFSVQVNSSSGTGTTGSRSAVEKNNAVQGTGTIVPANVTLPSSSGTAIFTANYGDIITLAFANNGPSNTQNETSTFSTYLHLVFLGSV